MWLSLTLAILSLLVVLNVALAKSRAYSAPPCRAGTQDVPACAAYIAYLSQALRSQTPQATNLGEGVAHVEFKILASGAFAFVRYSGSSPAHAEMALRILKSSRLRPPPGPYALAGQTFQFH
ncbi:MAG TPA: hypothetical protein VIF88_03660 [Methylocystis sp.]|jgi:protein TonB